MMPTELRKRGGRGAVAVIVENRRLLVIRRAPSVIAPRKFCFPGGGILDGESEQQAVVREIHEELGVAIEPLRRLWHSATPWGVQLAWWLARRESDAPLVPNPAEVESIHWVTLQEMAALSELLESNRHFLAAVSTGEIVLELPGDERPGMSDRG